MPPTLSIGLRIGTACLIATAWQLVSTDAARAQQPFATAPETPAAAPEAPGSTAMTTPAMTGPLVANPRPISFDTGGFGTIYFTGAISAMGLFQSDPVAGDHHDHVDLTNGQFMLQKTDGLFQFYAQAGAYSFPTVGTPYFHVGKITGDTFGAFPVGYAKIAPSDEFSIQAGKLPTLIGAEYAFTFQNMNIERGLLWNQEPIISRGVQANYTVGPLALNVSLNDGYYSDNYNWVSGLATYTINKTNTLAVAAGGNFSRTTRASFATPLAQNNSTLVNLIYTYNDAPWTITPYFQYTTIPTDATLGIARAETWGGAILASYALNDNVSLAGRVEYISSSGPGNVLYGPGSSAFSFTMTPTWQDGIYFLRGEASVVSAFSTTAGAAFGKAGNTKTQARWQLETGIIF
jgi:hypothetical protein